MGGDEEGVSARRNRGGNEESGESAASLDPDRERSYAELFEQLDLNKDGRVDIGELRTGLAARGLHRGEAEEVRRAGVLYSGTVPQAEAVGQVHVQGELRQL